MPSVKGIVAGGPVTEVTFPWGEDMIGMRVKPAGISTGEVIDADLTPNEKMGQEEQIQRMLDSIAQSIAKCLVGWNVYLDDDETEEVRTYEDILLLPPEFLMAAYRALKAHAEADASGEASATSAAG